MVLVLGLKSVCVGRRGEAEAMRVVFVGCVRREGARASAPLCVILCGVLCFRYRL